MNKKNQTKPEVTTPSIRYIEPDAYFKGMHDVPIEESLTETAAVFDQIKEQAKRESVDEIARLKGELSSTRRLLADARERWDNFRNETDGAQPGLFIPVVAVLFSVIAVFAEAWFLAPVLQGWNVNDPISQFVVAIIFVFAMGALMKTALACYELTKSTNTRENWFNAVALALFSLALAVYLGIFRADSLAYEARMNPELGGFLNESVGVNIALSILGTIALPLAATIALSFGCSGIRFFRQWRSARRDSLKLAAKETVTEELLLGETEKLERRVAEIEATCQEWQSAQIQAHGEGRSLGARRRPFWEEALLLAGGAGLIVTLVMVVAYVFLDSTLASSVQSDVARFVLYLGFGGALTAFFIYYVLTRWNSPTAAQAYRRRSPVWLVEQQPVEVGTKTTEPDRQPVSPPQTVSASPVPEKLNGSGNFAHVR